MTLPFIAAMMIGGVLAYGQDTSTDIPKAELPKAAPCVVCNAGGAAHGDEKAVAGVRYKGKAYYFCNAGEVATFKKEPDAFMPPVLPRPAPAFTLKNLAGETVKLIDLKGSVLLVDFWATWCAPCVAAMPDLQKLHEKLGAKGLKVLGLSIDEEGLAKVGPFITRKKFTYPVLLDDAKTWKTYGVRAIPALFLIDKSGQIVRQWAGKPDKKEVERAITPLIEK